jgi:regulator of protease activity HflC (stomatin/prohibitin superfamily)
MPKVEQFSPDKYFKSPKLIVFILVLLLLAFQSFYQIDQGDRGVVLRFGKVNSVSEPGFHFKLPLIDTIKTINIRTVKLYGAINDYGVATPINVYSSDIQAADVMISINYSILPTEVGNIYGKYGTEYEKSIIVPQLLSKSKDVFGRKNAVDTIRARDALAGLILDEMRDQLLPNGIIVESVQIENIDFSNEYEKSVEERMKAEVEVTRVKQNLEREKINADMVRTQAAGKADADVIQAEAEAKVRIIKAEADAKSITVVAIAEANAIKNKTESLTNNPTYIELVKAERWNGILPSTMLPNSSIPVLNFDNNN